MIDTILNRDEFINQPPVLVDIGASNSLPLLWESIAKYSVCVAFDPDMRDMDYAVKEQDKYKKLYIFPCIVTDSSDPELDFYLTESPYCSSLLEPDLNSLNDWLFSPFFTIKGKTKMKADRLLSVLAQLKISFVDWFKTDSQGLDLRLFRSMGEAVINRVLTADFEPGIIDAYKGEDKLWNLLSYMDKKPFWMSDMAVRGSVRIHSRYRSEKYESLLKKGMEISPGWAEVSYMNTFKNDIFSKRDFLLFWVFSIIKKQYSFALELCMSGMEKFNDPVFNEMENDTILRIKRLNREFSLKTIIKETGKPVFRLIKKILSCR